MNVLAVLYVYLLVAVVGCSSMPDGVKITDEERKACKVSMSCTVWSVEELQALIRMAMERGYRAALEKGTGI